MLGYLDNTRTDNVCIQFVDWLYVMLVPM